MRRATGAGTIETYGSQFRARLPDAKRTPIGVYESRDLAERALDGHFAVSRAPSGDSLASFAEVWLERRRRARPKSFERDMDRWKSYVEPWECYRWPMREIKRGDVRRWIDGLQSKPLADQTCRNALNLLRVCLRDALDDELVPSNSAVGVRVHPRGTTKDVWSYLRPDEQVSLLTLATLPKHLQALIAFAIGTGLRWGEQRKLELVDVHLEGEKPYVQVRRGANGSPKNTKHRKVPLFGVGLAGAVALVKLAAGRRNPRGLLCLPPRAEAYVGENGPRLERWLRLAKVARHVRWHDLRHTCGSSLVAGWWGHKWQLIEVRDFLGHGSITVTERYAHLSGTVVEDAASETARRHDGATSDIAKCLSHLRDSNSRPTVYETDRKARSHLRLAANRGAIVAPSLDELLANLRQAARGGI